jgi:hypothetical protein
MKIPFVQYPDTFRGFKHALESIFRRAAFPPFGLLTIATMLLQKWEKKFADINTENLSNKGIEWVDYFFPKRI